MSPRVALIGVLLCAGCRQTYVAGILQAGSGSAGSAGSTATGEGSMGTGEGSTATDGGSCSTTMCADDSTGASECLPPSPIPDCDVDDDPLRALGVACYEGVSAVLAETFTSPDPDAWRATREFGNAFWVSADSEAVLAITTGRLPVPGIAGELELEPSVGQPGVANDNPDGADPPPPISVTPGSNNGAGGSPFLGCDGVGDCSDTLKSAWASGAADDLVWFAFDVQVPERVTGYSAQVVLMTAEFPERVEDPASDTFVWWVSSESYTGNLATLGADPVTMTTLAPHVTFVGEHPALLRTGMDGVLLESCTLGKEVYDQCPVGATTDWLSLAGPAVPGETMSVVVAVFDQGDDQLDTTVLLDGWQWQCEGCMPGVDCGLQLP
ncbi:MAG: hypothetical protein AAGF11_50430 [Myxococcota bacterium]